MIRSKQRAFRRRIIIVTVLLLALLTGTVAAAVTILKSGDFVAGEDSDVLAMANGTRKREGRFDKVENATDGDKDKDAENDEDGNKDKKEESRKDEKKDVKREVEKTEHVEENGDVITTETTTEDQDIPFEIEQRNEQNLPRGEVKVVQAGVTGVRTNYFKLTYKNGGLVSKEEIGSEVTREPIKQVNLVGVSDYNLNTAYIQIYNSAKVTREGSISQAPAFMFMVDGLYYITFWFDPVTWANYTPNKPLQVAGGQFTYDGKTYQYNTGAVDEGYPLNMAFCNRYGLACGKW